MIYRILADIVLISHFAFVVFAVFGGLLVLRRRWVVWLHLPALVWSFAVEFFHLFCPLTTLENSLRQLGGEAGYEDSFINYFVSAVLYSPISPQTQVLLGFLLVAFNLFVYFYVLRRAFVVPRRAD